jgi:uncharacterized protein (DUF58 family)
MWFRDIFRPRTSEVERPLFDEAFLRRVERLSFNASRNLSGGLVGAHMSARQLPNTIFSDYRPYTSGDDLRYVDWNAYAREERIFVKLGETEHDIDVHILLDASRSMEWGRPTKLRLGQQLVAALGYLALARGDRLRVAPFGEGLGRLFGPARGQGRVPELLRFVAEVKAGTRTALAQAAAGYARQGASGGILVIVSDMLAPESLAEGLQHFAPPRWQVLLLHLIDPSELKPQLHGSLDLEDSETGERLSLVLDEETLEAYRRNLDTWLNYVQTSAARRGASYARLLTSWPLERQVIPYLRARQLLR